MDHNLFDKFLGNIHPIKPDVDSVLEAIKSYKEVKDIIEQSTFRADDTSFVLPITTSGLLNNYDDTIINTCGKI
jgi:hypothetical protein